MHKHALDSRSRHPISTVVSVALVALILALAPAAHAAVTNVAYWRFGENNPGAANGVTTTSTTNLVGGSLNLFTNATYTNAVSATAAAKVGSTLDLRFNSGNYGTNDLFNLTNNFGLEMWVRPDASNSTTCLAYSGNSAGSGWGLYIFGGRFVGLYGGFATFGTTPALTNVWTHLAVVRDNGTNRLYVNGVLDATTTTTPNAPVGRFAIGAQAQSLTNEFFAGSMDEVRVFSFAPGGFRTNDLLHFNQQPPVVTTTAATALGDDSATLNGTVNPGNLLTAAWFEWGTTTNYGSFTATNTLAVTNVALAVSNNLTGLVVNTTYHYRLAASNALGVSYGTNRTFTTPTFTTVPIAGLPGVDSSSVAWGDYDNDGRLDFLLTGAGNSGRVSQLWRNTGSGFTNVTASVALGLPQVYDSSVAWAIMTMTAASISSSRDTMATPEFPNCGGTRAAGSPM